MLLYRYGEAPTVDQVEDFKRVCSHFLEQHPGEIIGDVILYNHYSTSKMMYRCSLHSWIQQDWFSHHFLSC